MALESDLQEARRQLAAKDAEIEQLKKEGRAKDERIASLRVLIVAAVRNSK